MHLFKTITIALAFATSEATTRRRRNRYNDRPCGPGQHAILTPSKKTVANCVMCSVNTYRTDIKHSEEACLTCEAGRVSSEDFTYCIGDICKPGTYGTVGSNTCSKCLAGQYSILGQFSCTECESGRSNTVSGKGNCIGTMCPGGKYGLVGQITKATTSCTNCSKGKWAPGGTDTCEVCEDGKYSLGEAASCTSHESCSIDMYWETPPSTTSNKSTCVRCIYTSDIYSAGYFFACAVAIINTCLFLYDRNKNCHMLLFIVCSGGWALGLTTCSSRPHNILAIISMVMNAFCLLPAWGGFEEVCREHNKTQNIKKKKKTSQTLNAETEMTKKNEIGMDMVAV